MTLVFKTHMFYGIKNASLFKVGMCLSTLVYIYIYICPL